jgi:hypothetical protein
VHGYAQVRRYQQALVRGMQGARQADPLAVPETIAAHQAELEYLAADDQGDDDTFGPAGSPGSATTWTRTWTALPSPSRRPPSPGLATWTA